MLSCNVLTPEGRMRIFGLGRLETDSFGSDIKGLSTDSNVLRIIKERLAQKIRPGEQEVVVTLRLGKKGQGVRVRL